ncbi:MAG: L,D-transpeptidase family protein [Rhodobacteraceae bacterium]|nr:L,D-transpeptidase family protein [Paracoccaceae bacterium]
MSPHDLVLTPMGLRFMGQTYPCTIGQGGLTSDKQEGDRATPRGSHALTSVLYRPDRLTPPRLHSGLPLYQILPGDLWSDDPADPAYNSPVHAPYKYSAENLRRSAPVYDLIITSDWNCYPAIPGHGSAIFIHQWRRPGFPTAGCIGLPRTVLHFIAGALLPGAKLVVR